MSWAWSFFVCRWPRAGWVYTRTRCGYGRIRAGFQWCGSGGSGVSRLLAELVEGGRPEVRERHEALYVRVSGRTGQESSLAAQDAELRATAAGEVVAVFRDRASGLRESRPGLDRLLRRARVGEFTHVRVTHEDRLARFGTAWITALLDRDQVRVEVLHPRRGAPGGSEELLADFMALDASFSGRMYGIRSRQARRRLLEAAATSRGRGEGDGDRDGNGAGV